MSEDILEELAKKLSLTLAEKLENKEISVPEMAAAIDRFFEMMNKSQDLNEVKNYVESI